MPELHVVAGPNGVGKTTAFDLLVPEGLDYINADLIAKTIRERARGLNTQDLANSEAAKVFFEKAAKKESFAIETNLNDVATYKSFQGLQALGYKIVIYFLAVDRVTICIDRVRNRVKEGGHHVNPDIIQLRYTNGLALIKHYKDFPDTVMLMDNSEGDLVKQAELHKGIVQQIANPCKQWVLNVIDQKQSLSSSPKDESIEEVKRRYKKGRGL